MKPDLVLNGLRLILALTLSFSAPLCPSAVAEIAYVDDIEIEAAAELSREIGWFEAATGKVVKDRIVRRFSLLCTQGSCFLTVVSIPASNCRKADDVAKLKSVGPVL